MSFAFDLPVLIVIGFLLYGLGSLLNIKRLSKITIGILIVSCFIIFSVMLYFDVFNFNFPTIPFNETGSKFMFDYLAIGFNKAGSNFTLSFSWQQLPISWFNKQDVPSSVVIILFLLYPVSIYLGYAFALWLYKKIKYRNNISAEKKTYANVTSRRKAGMPAEKPKYFIARDPNIRRAVEKAIHELDPVNGIKKFVKPDDTVLIKVNICGGIPDNPGSFTSPEVVGYVVDLIDKEVGGNTIIICDADMIWTKFSENARAIGWDKWVEEIKSRNKRLKDVKLVNLSKTELIYFDFGERSIFQRHEDRPNQEIVSTEMLNAKVIISIPKMKTHLLTGVTLGMKNMYGTFPEEDKARFHTEGINDVIYWVNNAFPPNLTIIDGIIGGENIGPLSVRQIEDYNTIIASNSAPIADAIASKLIGYDDPFNQIEHLKLTKEKELDDPDKPLNERFLLSEIHEDVNKTLEELTNQFPKSKDGNWERPDDEAAKHFEHLMENILAIPGMEFFFNIGADFLLFDLARIPLLKYFNEAILEFLYEVPRFWSHPKNTQTNLTRRDWFINLIVFLIFVIFSVVCLVHNYITPIKQNHYEWSQWILLGFILSIILFWFFALILNMKTKNLVGITTLSWVVALFVESFAPYAKWWNYTCENDHIISNYINLILSYAHVSTISISPISFPSFPVFSIPIFIVMIIGISYFIVNPIFAYVDLKDERFKWVPLGIVTIPLLALLYLGGYLDKSPQKEPIIAIYIVLVVLAGYFNKNQSLEWNLSIAIVAIVLGGTMEYLGFKSGFWNYSIPNIYPDTYFPIFVSLTWPLNTWAACGLAQIFGIDMRKAFPFTEKIAISKREEDAKIVTESVDSIFGAYALIVREALKNKDGPGSIDDLMNNTHLKREEIYGALGWLGRENEITVEKIGNIRYFSLRP